MTSVSRVRSIAAALMVATALASSPAVAEDYFIPGQAKPAAQTPARPRTPARPATPRPDTAVQQQTGPQQPVPPPSDDNTDAAVAAAQMQLPPAQDLPALPKTAAPPAAVIGVIGVPEVMRASAAAQQVEKTITQRREKLAQDAQKEQAAWRDMQQSLVNDRAKLSDTQVRARERELQERITNAQKQFRERGRIIQDAAQYALAQIERTLVGVIRQVADSHGMNLVLHRAQVALNTQEFDITEQVAEQLNKLTPTVVIPPEGQEPPMQPTATAAPGATPASTPAPAAPAH